MSTATSFTGYITDAATIPAEAVIGHLVWFTISGADVPIAQVTKLTKDLGLIQDHLRTKLRPIDAYRKATKEVATKLAIQDDIQSSFLVRPVGQDSATAHRHVVLERARMKQGQRRRLSYDAMAELVFERGKKNADGTYSGYRLEIVRKNTTIDLSTEEKGWLDGRLDALQDRFRHHLSHLDSHAIRTYVREYLYHLNGICVKPSGGVYFVRQSHHAQLTALAEFTQAVGSDFHMVPLLDLGDQRKMLLQAFEEETVGELKRMSAEIADILKDSSRSITGKTFDAYSDKIVQLTAKAAEYRDLLNDKTESTDLQLKMFRAQALKLAERIK